jgi:SAM-dependent methyltransferase
MVSTAILAPWLLFSETIDLVHPSLRSAEEMVAHALEMDVSLLPFAAELLTDFTELGSDAELIAETITALELPDVVRVVDLGSGKGGVALEIAESLDCEVVGIELFEPFVRSANALAESLGVASKCRFVHGDVLQMFAEYRDFDVAVYAALGDVLGSLEMTIGVLRRYVRTGGYLVISDVFVKDGGSTQFEGFENYARLDEVRRQLTAHGDVLFREVFETDDEEEDDEEADAIMRRASVLVQAHPEHAEALLAFARAQSDQYAYMESNLTGAIWVLQRT